MEAPVGDRPEAVMGTELDRPLVALTGQVAQDAQIVGARPGQLGDLEIGGHAATAHGRVDTDALQPALVVG